MRVMRAITPLKATHLLIGHFSAVLQDALFRKGTIALQADPRRSLGAGPHHRGDGREALLLHPFEVVILSMPCKNIADSDRHPDSRVPKVEDGRMFFGLLAVVYMICQAWGGRVAAELPPSVLDRLWDAALQVVDLPWFGDECTKPTVWRTRGLPALRPTNLIHGKLPSLAGGVMEYDLDERERRKAVFTPGMSDAIADAWCSSAVQASGIPPAERLCFEVERARLASLWTALGFELPPGWDGASALPPGGQEAMRIAAVGEHRRGDAAREPVRVRATERGLDAVPYREWLRAAKLHELTLALRSDAALLATDQRGGAAPPPPQQWLWPPDDREAVGGYRCKCEWDARLAQHTCYCDILSEEQAEELEEGVSVSYMQCKHGWVYIGGTRDETLKPVCTKSACVRKAKAYYREREAEVLTWSDTAIGMLESRAVEEWPRTVPLPMAQEGAQGSQLEVQINGADDLLVLPFQPGGGADPEHHRDACAEACAYALASLSDPIASVLGIARLYNLPDGCVSQRWRGAAWADFAVHAHVALLSLERKRAEAVQSGATLVLRCAHDCYPRRCCCEAVADYLRTPQQMGEYDKASGRWRRNQPQLFWDGREALVMGQEPPPPITIAPLHGGWHEMEWDATIGYTGEGPLPMAEGALNVAPPGIRPGSVGDLLKATGFIANLLSLVRDQARGQSARGPPEDPGPGNETARCTLQGTLTTAPFGSAISSSLSQRLGQLAHLPENDMHAPIPHGAQTLTLSLRIRGGMDAEGQQPPAPAALVAAAADDDLPVIRVPLPLVHGPFAQGGELDEAEKGPVLGTLMNARRMVYAVAQRALAARALLPTGTPRTPFISGSMAEPHVREVCYALHGGQSGRESSSIESLGAAINATSEITHERNFLGKIDVSRIREFALARGGRNFKVQKKILIELIGVLEPDRRLQLSRPGVKRAHTDEGGNSEAEAGGSSTQHALLLPPAEAESEPPPSGAPDAAPPPSSANPPPHPLALVGSGGFQGGQVEVTPGGWDMPRAEWLLGWPGHRKWVWLVLYDVQCAFSADGQPEADLVRIAHYRPGLQGRSGLPNSGLEQEDAPTQGITHILERDDELEGAAIRSNMIGYVGGVTQDQDGYLTVNWIYVARLATPSAWLDRSEDAAPAQGPTALHMVDIKGWLAAIAAGHEAWLALAVRYALGLVGVTVSMGDASFPFTPHCSESVDRPGISRRQGTRTIRVDPHVADTHIALARSHTTPPIRRRVVYHQTSLQNCRLLQHHDDPGLLAAIQAYEDALYAAPPTAPLGNPRWPTPAVSALTCTTRRPVWLLHNIKAARLAIARINCRRGHEAGVQLWAPGQRSEEDRQILIGPCLTVAAEIWQVPEGDLRPALPGSRAPPRLLAIACAISRAPQWGWELGHPLLHSHLPPEPPPFYFSRDGVRLSSTTAPVAVHADKTACSRHQCTYAALREARTALYQEVSRIEADLGLPDLINPLDLAIEAENRRLRQDGIRIHPNTCLLSSAKGSWNGLEFDQTLGFPGEGWDAAPRNRKRAVSPPLDPPRGVSDGKRHRLQEAPALGTGVQTETPPAEVAVVPVLMRHAAAPVVLLPAGGGVYLLPSEGVKGEHRKAATAAARELAPHLLGEGISFTVFLAGILNRRHVVIVLAGAGTVAPAVCASRAQVLTRALEHGGLHPVWCPLSVVAEGMGTAGNARDDALRADTYATASAAILQTQLLARPGKPASSTGLATGMHVGGEVQRSAASNAESASFEAALSAAHAADAQLRAAILAAAASESDTDIASALTAWADRFAPLRQADVPTSLSATTLSFSSERLGTLPFPSRTRVLRTEPLPPPKPQPPLPPSFRPRSIRDVLFEGAIKSISKKLDEIGRWHRKRKKGVAAPRPAPLALGEEAIRPEARGYIWDLRGCSLSGGAPVPLDTVSPSIKSHLNVDYLEELFADCVDRELVSMLRFGVHLHAELPPQILIMPNLLSLYDSDGAAGGVNAAADAFEELRRLGWLDRSEFIPFVPWRCAPRGTVVKKDGGLPRGIVDQGAPRVPLSCSLTDEPVQSLNEASRAQRQRYEYKPLFSDLAVSGCVLRHIADKLGLPVFTIAVDFSKYFHQCFFTARELWKCGALMPRAAEGGGASDQLDAWTELVMSMGLVPSSEIAQRLSNALMQAFSRELAKAEAREGWVCTPTEQRWRQQREAMPQDMLGSQARMWDCMCYTDDPAVLVVGVDRAVLALKVLHRILKSSGLMVAKASKWQIGSGALWLGGCCYPALGVMWVPPAKAAGACTRIETVLDGTCTAAAYRELVGFLEHVLCICKYPREMMDYLHEPMRSGQCDNEPASRLAPDGRRDGYLRKWRALLSDAPGASLLAAVDAIPPTPGSHIVWRLCSDAALEVNLSCMGGFFYGKWWQLHLRRPCLTIPVLEFLAACVNFILFEPSIRHAREVVIEIDALASPIALAKDAAKADGMRAVLAEFRRLPQLIRLLDSACHLTCRHVFGEANPAADAASRGYVSELQQLCASLGVHMQRVALSSEALAFIDRVLARLDAQPLTVAEREFDSTLGYPGEGPTVYAGLGSPPPGAAPAAGASASADGAEDRVYAGMASTPGAGSSSLHSACAAALPASPAMRAFLEHSASEHARVFGDAQGGGTPVQLPHSAPPSLLPAGIDTPPPASTAAPGREGAQAPALQGSAGEAYEVYSLLADSPDKWVEQPPPSPTDFHGPSQHTTTESLVFQSLAGSLRAGHGARGAAQAHGGGTRTSKHKKQKTAAAASLQDGLGLAASERARSLAAALESNTSEYGLRLEEGEADYLAEQLVTALERAGANSTKANERSNWKHWIAFCTHRNTKPFRMDVRHLSPREQDSEVVTLALALLFIYSRMGQKPGRKTPPKPSSALAVLRGVRRTHDRLGIKMADLSLATKLADSLTRDYVAMYGAEALQPDRVEPLTNQIISELLALEQFNMAGDISSLSNKALFATLAQTGFRKAEVSLGAHDAFGKHSLTRASVLWRIGGATVHSPTESQLRSLQEGDMVIIIPPRSKCDPFGLEWGQHPIYLRFHPSKPICAARALRDLELAMPLSTQAERERTALFVDKHGLPIKADDVDRLLKSGLAQCKSVADGRRYSPHSFRRYLACALKADGNSDSTIQALLRWKTAESLRIYAVINDTAYADLVDAAGRADVSSVRTASLPRSDSIVDAGRLNEERERLARAAQAAEERHLRGQVHEDSEAEDAGRSDSEEEGGMEPAPVTQAAQAAPRGRRRGQLQDKQATLPATAPLTLENAAGRAVLVPREVWPDLECAEHNGLGWSGRIATVDKRLQAGRVAFDSTDHNGRKWQPCWLLLSALRGA